MEDLIIYFRALRKGFDNELYQSKVDELGYLVDSIGLSYDDFQALFKIWLNLNIPMTKWVSLGTCLVPNERVNKDTIECSLRWIFVNYENQSKFTKIGFLLDWLTAAMDCDFIDINALDAGYEVFFMMLSYEVLVPHVLKLVHTLTKPADVIRQKVLVLVNYAKNREGKKHFCRSIQVLLGLFKSYKPEYVPEDVPSISIHTAFRKINVNLSTRFKRRQSQSKTDDGFRLYWNNPLHSKNNKKVEQLVPSLEYLHIGSKLYENQSQKNYLDFSEPVSLLQYSVEHEMRRPARLRALLCNPTGLTLLVLANQEVHASLSYQLLHLLDHCMFETSGHSYEEKQDFLRRLAVFQSTLKYGLPAITWFLVQYLLFWNEKDFFDEILSLIEWVNVESPEKVSSILDSLAKIFYRSHPIEQCAILNSVTTMYKNMAVISRQAPQPLESVYWETLTMVSVKISDMCDEALRRTPGVICEKWSWKKNIVMICTAVLPKPVVVSTAIYVDDTALLARNKDPRIASIVLQQDDLRLLNSVMVSNARRARTALSAGLFPPPPRPLMLALPLLSSSVTVLDHLLEITFLYKNIRQRLKSTMGPENPLYVETNQIVKAFSRDLVRCLYTEDLFKYYGKNQRGLLANKLNPQLVSQLIDLIPDVDSQLSLRNHWALAPNKVKAGLYINNLGKMQSNLLYEMIEGVFHSLGAFVQECNK